METKITATELARNLSDILNRASYRGEAFMVERNGQSVCRIEPTRARGCSWDDLVRFFETAPKPDDEYLDILEEITRNQPAAPAPPEW